MCGDTKKLPPTISQHPELPRTRHCSKGAATGGDRPEVLTLSPASDIPPCLDSELGEFPLRMRDWLKNVLVTLYERDEGNNLLTEKQKLRVSTTPSRVGDAFPHRLAQRGLRYPEQAAGPHQP